MRTFVEDTFLSKKLKIDVYLNTDKESLDLILLRMTVKDSFSFNVFTSSTVLKLIHLTIEGFCNRDSNLLTEDAVLKILFMN